MIFLTPGIAFCESKGLAAIGKTSFNEGVEFTAKNFLILNGTVVTLLVLSFLAMRRSSKPPTRLELRDEDEVASDNAREVKKVPEKPPPKYRDPRLEPAVKKPVGWDNYQPRVRHPAGDSPAGSVRAVNLQFMWNGHSWDAYEVLGLPAGSSLEAAQVAFQRAAALADQETLPFLRAALDAIAKSGRD